jgi:ArsR family transcriptional regulator
MAKSTTKASGRGGARRAAPMALSESLMNDAALEMVASRFRLLGDPSRLRLLNILMHGEQTVQELVDASGLSQTNVSRHLALMRRDGVVGRSRDGNFAVYRVADPTIEKLCTLVCGGLSRRRSDDLDELHGTAV